MIKYNIFPSSSTSGQYRCTEQHENNSNWTLEWMEGVACFFGVSSSYKCALAVLEETRDTSHLWPPPPRRVIHGLNTCASPPPNNSWFAPSSLASTPGGRLMRNASGRCERHQRLSPPPRPWWMNHVVSRHLRGAPSTRPFCQNQTQRSRVVSLSFFCLFLSSPSGWTGVPRRDCRTYVATWWSEFN